MIEVGEYIRTKDGQIGIFQNIDEHVRHYGERLEDTIYIINTEKNEYLRLTDNDIKSHSKNIIDLIEVGDYVNGYKVELSRYDELYFAYVYCGGIGVRTTEAYETFIKDMKVEDIESIVTKEQFEGIEYKIGE